MRQSYSIHIIALMWFDKTRRNKKRPNKILIFVHILSKNILMNHKLGSYNMCVSVYIKHFLDVLNVNIKNNFKKIKKYYWYAFQYEKLFEKQSLPNIPELMYVMM